MARTPGAVLSLVLLLSITTGGASQDAAAEYRTVGRFAQALSEGDAGTVWELLSPTARWSEFDVHLRVFAGRADAFARLNELIRGGVRLETELVDVVDDGRSIVAHERMWGDFVDDDLAPLRSTTEYVVDAGRLVAVTRVLASEQRDALTESFAVGAWAGILMGYARVLDDATWRVYPNLSDLRADRPRHVAERWGIQGGVVRSVAGEDSQVCSHGERIAQRIRVIDEDTLVLTVIREETECAYFRRPYMTPLTLKRFADE